MCIKGNIIITLKSNLCTGSGYSYAGLIDNDVCFDQYGLPYIPARRIKGCLRQSATDYLKAVLTDEDIEKIFGVSGDSDAKGIVIGNAYLLESEALTGDLDVLFSNPLVNHEKILEQFTSVIGQTKLNDGIADDNTLRYTRVINHYSPVDGKELVFSAPVLINSDNSKYIDDLKMIVKATRNIGLKRNRGLGSVKCEAQLNIVHNDEIVAADGNENVVVEFTIVNESPLIVASSSDTASLKYIPGQTMLGFMAGAYLKMNKLSSEEASKDEVFNDLFVMGETKFLNLVPSKNGKLYHPTPNYVNQLKKTKKLVNIIADNKYSEEMDAIYNPNQGNQPKKLRDRFSFINNNFEVDTLEIDTQMVYHHAHQSEKNPDGLLYCMEVISKGQEYTGQIITQKRYLPIIKSILKECDISLGKSRTAQYGRCKLISMHERSISEDITIRGKVVVTLLSDAIFMNKSGEYTVYEDEVYELIAEELGIKINGLESMYPSMLSTKLVFGYQSTWNLRKMPIPVVAAGSSFIFDIDDETVISSQFIGARSIEGYGLFRIDSLNNMNYIVKKYENVDVKNNQVRKVISDTSAKLAEKILIDEILNTLKLEAVNNNNLANISASAIGRITLMLKESLSENPTDPDAAKEDFRNRIESIKTDSVRNEGEKIYKKVTNLKVPEGVLENELAYMLGYQNGVRDLRGKIGKHWGEYAMVILTLQKYEKSAKEAKR